MSLKKKELTLKKLLVSQNLIRYTSLMNYSSSKENKSPFPIKNDVSLKELFHILECLIRVEDKFSLKDNKSKSFKMVMAQLSLGVISLDKENVGLDVILKHLLEESKVLGLHVNDMDFAVDMLKTVKRLELKHESFQYSRTRLEVLLANLYVELKAAPEWKEIRDELFFSLSLSHSSDRARILLNAIEFNFPRYYDLSAEKDYLPVCNIEMKDYVSETFLVTTEEITSAYSNLTTAISRLYLFPSIAQVKEQIQSSKKELRKRHVSYLSILLGTARALRIMLLDNPKKIKVKKARIRNKKIKESKKIEEVKELEEPKDSE